MSTSVCELCLENPSKYCCPRCNKNYCSLFCYKSEKHLQCSENFYKDCVIEHLKEKSDNKASDDKIKCILNRIKNEQIYDDIDLVDSDEEICEDLEERLANCNLDDSDSIWNVLTNDERQEFQSLLNSGEVYKLIPKWGPWWEKGDENVLVKEIQNNVIKYPSIKKDIIDLKDLSSNQPSPVVKNNIINVLAAYALTIRYFNGEHYESCIDSTTYLLKLSKNLDANQNFDSVKEAVKSVDLEYGADESVYDMLIVDINNIISFKLQIKNESVLCVLSDISSLVEKCLSNIKLSRMPNKICEDNKLKKMKLKLLLKKINYYLSYAQICDFVNLFEIVT